MAVTYFNQVHHEKKLLKVCYIYYIPSKLFAVCVCVRVEHFYKIYKEYSFKKKTTFFSDMMERRKFRKFMVRPSALVSTSKSSSCLCKYKSYSNSHCVRF